MKDTDLEIFKAPNSFIYQRAMEKFILMMKK